MMVGPRNIEVTHDVSRGLLCLLVGAVRLQMRGKPFERRALRGDAFVASSQHVEWFVERGGGLTQRVERFHRATVQ